MFLDYLKEREGCEIIKSEYGFIAYSLHGRVCLIHEIYIAPEFRKKHHASYLANEVTEIAKHSGCTQLQCLVDLRSRCFEVSLLSIVKYGFKFCGIDREQLRFFKKVV